MSVPDRSGTILLYHGVTDSESAGIENFSGKHLRAEEFERQMRRVATDATPVTLREMVAMLASDVPLPERCVAVTFDDTFANVCTVALPILERHGVPATFFVSTGFVGTDRLFWVDELEHLINATDVADITVPVAGRNELLELGSHNDRIAAVVAIKRAMKAIDPAGRNALLADVRKQTGDPGPYGGIDNYRNLDWEQVARLHTPPDYEVGGHTVNHEILAYLDDATRRLEIRGCLEELRTRLGEPIDLFSYPEGQPEHYDEATISDLKRAGVSICPSAVAGVNQPGEDPFHLRRIMPGFMGQQFPFPDPDPHEP